MSVEFGIVTSIVPPRGWHLKQSLSSGDVITITGFSFEQLLGNVVDFRQRHLDLCGGSENATIEAVRRDLKTYLCQNYRQNCGDAPGAGYAGAIGIVTKDHYSKPIDKVSNWLAAVGNLQVEKVDAALAAARAHTCATCRENIRWATPCGPCNDNVLGRVQNLKGSFFTPYDKHLFACRLFGHSNEVAVWLTDTHSSSEQKAPKICWKVQENG